MTFLTRTVMWAARDVWQETIEEFFNHDISPEINQISDLITKSTILICIYSCLNS
jgi:hypothetical protein